MIRVLVICDSALVRDGIRALFASSGEFELVGDAASFAEGLQVLPRTEPDVVLMDVSLRVLEATDTAAAIRARRPAAAIVMLCRHCGNHPCAGVPGPGNADLLLSKTLTGGEALMRAVRDVYARKSSGEAVPPAPAASDGRSCCSLAAWASLSAREREVVEMVAAGKTSGEIARVMKLSPKTVQTYRARIMSKLRVRRVPELIACAVRFGLATLH